VSGKARCVEARGDSPLTPDIVTQELMTRFYDRWRSGVDQHDALRHAQLEMRQIVRTRYGRDLPDYWGAFRAGRSVASAWHCEGDRPP